MVSKPGNLIEVSNNCYVFH